MALIGTIRRNGWILIVTMVLALGGFILMDIMSNSQRYSAGDINTIGRVGNTEIKRNEFDTYEKLIYSQQQPGTQQQIRSQIWTYFAEKATVEQVAKEMGIGVGKEELLDLEFGTNLSPIIVERFKNPDGTPNRNTLNSIRNSIESGQFTDPQNRAYWAVQEKEIIKARLQEKITNAVSKSMFTPKWQAEMAFRESNERRDFLVVRIPYDQVSDEEVPLTDSDYKAFLKEYPGVFDQEDETRTVSFISFDVVPTAEDSAMSRNSAMTFVKGFRTATNDSVYALSNGGVYNNMFVPKANFPAAIADSIGSRPVGSVFGPVFDEGEWRAVKIIARRILPDSVKARHILIRDATPENESRIDSIMNLIKSGRQRFDSLAMRMSQDVGSGRQGGDLGWFGYGTMVNEFNELCFVTGEQGKLYKISTQFGWHIVEITGKKFITNDYSAKVAVIGRRLEPSKTTQQSFKDKAIAIVQQAKTLSDLEALANQQRLVLQETLPLKQNDFNLGAVLGLGDDARQLIRWAYSDGIKVGAVSPEVFTFRDQKGGYFDTRYVVAALKNIVPKGKATIATLKALPEAETRVRNLKKAGIILSKIKASDDLSALAAEWNTRIDTIRSMNFYQAGSEPRVGGTLFGLPTGQVSKPIVAGAGIAIIKPYTDISQPQMPADMTLYRRQMSSQAITAMRTSLMKSLMRESDIQDNRYRFW